MINMSSSTAQDLTSEEIFPYVVVYRGLIPDCAKLLSVIKNDTLIDENGSLFNGWNDWYGFGEKIEFNSDPGLIELDKSNNKIQNQLLLISRILEIRKTAIDDYVRRYSIPLPKGSCIQNSVQVAKYHANFVLNGEYEYAMLFHTDFDCEKIEQTEMNFLITANIYFNDDYADGGLQFTNIKQFCSYKPSSGDVVVFPSGSPLFPNREPYYHAVDAVRNAPKYFSRNYMMYTHSKIDEMPNDSREQIANIEFDDNWVGPNQMVIVDGKLIMQPIIKKYYDIAVK